MKHPEKTGEGLLIFVMVFYIGVALLGTGLLNIRSSIFKSRPLFPAFTQKAENPSQLKSSIVTGNVDRAVPIEYEEPSEPEPVLEESEPYVEEPVQVEEAKHYYEFTAINSTTILHMREEPDINSRSIYKLKPGTTGYVLELGDDWSLVTAEEHVGYCSNEYLNMREIPEEEYPEELR